MLVVLFKIEFPYLTSLKQYIQGKKKRRLFRMEFLAIVLVTLQIINELLKLNNK